MMIALRSRKILLVVPALLHLGTTLVSVSGQRFDCEDGANKPDDDNCVDRPSYYIKVIVHGTSQDADWRQLRTSMLQTARDLKIDLEMDLYDIDGRDGIIFDPQRMANDIKAVASSEGAFRPDALIVTVPDATVQAALGEMMESSPDIPVFGLNSGGELAQTLGILGYVSMDEYYAGTVAGDYLKGLLPVSDGSGSNQTATVLDLTNTKGLYINHDCMSSLPTMTAGFLRCPRRSIELTSR